MSNYSVAQPRIVVNVVDGGFRAVVHFPSGPLNGRRPVVGLVAASVSDAIAAALGAAVPVIVDIVTPVEYP